MKRNFDIPLLHADGEQFVGPPTIKKDSTGRPVLDKDNRPILEKEGDKLTVANLIYHCLLNTAPDEGTETGDSKFKRWKIAAKVSDGGEQEYSIDDLKLIKDRVGKMATAAEIGAAFEALEDLGDEKPDKKKK